MSSSLCSQPTNLDGKRNVIDALPLSFPFISVANCVITTDNGNGFKNVVIRQCYGAERSNASDKEITKLIKEETSVTADLQSHTTADTTRQWRSVRWEPELRASVK